MLTRGIEDVDGKALLAALTALKNGDFSVRMPANWSGMAGKIAATLNDIIEMNQQMTEGITDVSRVVGREGQLTQRVPVHHMVGGWAGTIKSVNTLIDDLVLPTTEMTRVIGAVAKGDLSQTMVLDVDGRPLKGQFLQLASIANTMLDQLSSFASEAKRVAREVGIDGKLGGQAQVEGAAGTWKDLIDSVNFMAANLTAQVRGIAGVVSAVAQGDLKKKMTVAARGEIAALANTINEMTDTLAVFADQATTVAREVGVEGKLGGQASVPGAAGTWKDLTDNVNQLAANLTNQVRAIAEVATAVTRGDLSRSIQVDARGEVSYLKDNINEMIRNLKETTKKNAQQDWLKTNLARFNRLLQGQRDLAAVSELILSELAPLVSAHHGVFYMVDSTDPDGRLRMIASYGYRSSRELPSSFTPCDELVEQDAIEPQHDVFYMMDSAGRNARRQMIASYGYRSSRELPTSFLPGDGLVGQCALEKHRILLTNVPCDYVASSASGLGGVPPNNIMVLPIPFEHEVKAVIEIASLERFTETHLSFLDQLMESIGVVLNTIEANSRTESLLIQSQSLAQELQQTNQELAEKARLLSEQNIEVERKNSEVEQAKLALEDKAAQLALSSKYKSEFLANMSHELRTPLNSLLILAQQLHDNPRGNLTSDQVEFAKAIHSSGSDLLTLINDILDLSKIESGTATLEISEYCFNNLRNCVNRTFGHMAEAKHIKFSLELAEDLPATMMTDTTRLQQILKNLLSNAFKFTLHGQVSLKIGMAKSGWTIDHPHLAHADMVMAFSVADTGIGIAKDKLQLIFEAFQQADGSTARKYGGTGLGLSISRELARLLSGEIRVKSKVDEGSTFTLFLPYNRSGSVSDSVNDDSAHQAHPQTPALANKVIHAHDEELETTDYDEPAQYVSKQATTLKGSDEFPVADRALIASGGLSASIVEEDAPQLAGNELAGRKVLIVDDDMRNIFALSSVLEWQQMQILFAENGRDGIDMLKKDPSIEIVLMDVMMPEMDGYDTMRAIRAIPKFELLPIISLTAKAMKGDREKCIAAGASDYITKPVVVAQLLSLMRIWLRE
jgi:signal transduction histidine kinase/CheY-like chemotaxis protein/HAMP domain-containing protein